MDYLIALLIAHFCGDILFYTSFISGMKRSDKILDKITGLTVHCIIHAILVTVVLYVLNLSNILWGASMVFFFHLLIDLSRPYYEKLLIPTSRFVVMEKKDFFRWLTRREESSNIDEFMANNFLRWVLINVSDQSLHLLSLFAISYLLNN